MTNLELDYRAMARRTQQMLADTRATWAPATPRLVADYDHLVCLLDAFDAVGTLRAGTGTRATPMPRTWPRPLPWPPPCAW